MAKTCLKVIKARCFRLMSLYHLKPCMSRSQTAWSRRAGLAERSRSSFALTIVCRFLPFLSSGDAVDDHQWEVQVYVLDSMLEPIVGVELPKKVFISRAR
jgi:hypothetical protein